MAVDSESAKSAPGKNETMDRQLHGRAIPGSEEKKYQKITTCLTRHISQRTIPYGEILIVFLQPICAFQLGDLRTLQAVSGIIASLTGHIRDHDGEPIISNMMHASGESTPLLRRTGRKLDDQKNNGSLALNQRDTSQYSNGIDKQDRRGLLYRSLAWVHINLQRVSLYFLPPMDDDYCYEDTHNDDPWKCTFGTREENGVWANHSDRVGSLMAIIVWILMIYSAATMLTLMHHNHMPRAVAYMYCTVVCLALASHAKTAFTDPGSIPCSAIPLYHQKFHSMCSICQSYKPDKSHHCRICNRCISGMDHHCPWMNNCVGALNMKHFILFLLYTWTASAWALIVFAVNYFFCSSENCEFAGVEIVLVRAMTCIGLGTLLFTSTMIMNVVFAIITGASTIDRLKMKLTNTWDESIAEPIPLENIFGIGSVWTWALPIDPVFDDYQRITGYATRQRLLRQQAIAREGVNKNLSKDISGNFLHRKWDMPEALDV